MVLPGFSGNFLSLQFASDTCHLYTSTLFKFLMGGVQGAGCLNQPGHLKLKLLYELPCAASTLLPFAAL